MITPGRLCLLCLLLAVGTFVWLASHNPPPTEPARYTRTCADGWLTHSVGPGTCSHHGGER